MLSNVVAPLFPVVDYQAFHRTNLNEKDCFQTYQTGIRWMFRGLIHLLLYRLVAQDFLLASSFTNFWRRINIYWKQFMELISTISLKHPLKFCAL